VRLCGHATLATAAVLFREVEVETAEVQFETRSGTLLAQMTDQGIALDFPADPPHPYPPPAGVLEALGIEDDDIETVAYAPKTHNLLIHLKSAALVRNLTPDFVTLGALTTAADLHGPIVTAPGAPPYDFVSRYFAPGVGIDEDPVTGSAHTVLGPYWSERLGKTELFAYQASKRGGEVRVRLTAENRIMLIGQAVVIAKGSLLL
jgi:PhzF family phenazine biosynthesis protein